MSGSASNKKNSGGWFAPLVIVIALAVAFAVYFLVFGNPSNFEGNDPSKNPIPGNYFGMIYKGGMVVPFLMTMFILVVTFSIERFITIGKAAGIGSVDRFMHKVREALAMNNVNAAVQECDKQKGSVANVIRSGLTKYQEMEADKGLDKDQKVLAIQKELEEATGLELPALEKNLVFLATIASVGTLVALLGTVLGMIRAFAALASAGSPDSVALATGISEALINTALGIATSAIAIIMYNFFTTKIDKLTYSIDEGGYTIVKSFDAFHGKN